MGISMNEKKGKTKVKSAARFSTTAKIIVGLAIMVVVIVGVNISSSMSLRQTVDVVKLKSAVPQDGRVTSDIMYKDPMLISEYNKQGMLKLSDGTQKRAIVLWDDREKLVNAYASYYIRQNSPVYWDSLSSESPKKYSYLYKMDGELLKIAIKADEFGGMLVPGDKVNIRAIYSEPVYTLPDASTFTMQQQTGVSAETTKKRQIKLFDSTSVLDILNSNGDSIFDIYYKLLALPKAEQSVVLATPEFIASVKPQSILLNVTPEEADNYMSIQGKGPTYMLTLLPRTSGNLITEALNELQTGVARTTVTD